MALLTVVELHFVDVTLKIVVGNEACQRVLLKARHGAAIEAHGLLIARQQATRQDHVADAQRGHKALGEGVDINDTVLRVLRVERQDEASVIAEFAVIIVLNDVTLADAVHPFKQFNAARDGHDNACGEVIGRRDVYDIGAAFLERVDLHAAFVDGDIFPGITVAGGDGGEFFIARLLDGEGAGRTEHLQQAAIKIFCACADDNLCRVNLHGTVVCQIVRYRLTQLVDAVVGHSFQQLVVLQRQCFAHDAAPRSERKILQADTVGLEVREIFLFARLRQSGCSAAAAQTVVADVLDEIAKLFLRGDIAFDSELGVGVGDGDDTDAEMLRQRALGGQAVACVQDAGDDVLTDALVEIFVERRAAALVQIIG